MKFSIGLLYVRPSVSQSVSQLKTIKARSIKLGTRIGSNVYNMHAQNLGCYLEGQGHKMTLQQNRVRSITWAYLKFDFTTISQKWSPYWDDVSRTNLGWYLEGQGHSMTFQQNRVRPITLLFEVGFYNYSTEMITILRWGVAHKIWVGTLKVKVIAWPCSKIVSGP